MKSKKVGRYDPDVELAKGAMLDAASYDKTQKIKVTTNKVTVGGQAGRAEISGIATGKSGAGIDGTINLWLSIFRYMRPDESGSRPKSPPIIGHDLASSSESKNAP